MSIFHANNFSIHVNKNHPFFREYQFGCQTMEMRRQGVCLMNGAICAKQHMASNPKGLCFHGWL
jgi:hypothetical protein